MWSESRRTLCRSPGKELGVEASLASMAYARRQRACTPNLWACSWGPQRRGRLCRDRSFDSEVRELAPSDPQSDVYLPGMADRRVRVEERTGYAHRAPTA